MIEKFLLSNDNLDYESMDYLSKTKTNSIRIHIYLQVFFNIFLIAYSVVFKFKLASIYGQTTIFLMMVVVYFIMIRDRNHKKVSIILPVFYTIFVTPAVNLALGSVHPLPILMSLYSVVLIVILLEGKLRMRLLYLYIFISSFISYKDYIVISGLSGANIAINRLISLLLAFILVTMTVWVFKDTVVILSDENYKRSLTDHLTGVYNYKSFENELNKSINLYQRYRDNFTIAMIDIDNFKLLNDQFGHRDGDEFLREFVKHVKTHIRAEDFLARYGGDEFVILFPRANKTEASKVIDRLYQENSQLLEKYEDLNISFSCGLCDYREANKLDKEILRVADSRMYQAKKLGKNKYLFEDEKEL